MLRARSESGQAVVAVVAVTFVLAVLVATLLAVGLHTNDVTVADRAKLQGAQSAESALSLMVDALTRSLCVPDRGLPSSPAGSPSSPLQVGAGSSQVGQYQAVVRLPSEAGSLTPVLWNPNQTTSAACTTNPPADNERTITAWGYGPSAGSQRAQLRRLEAKVSLVPLTGYRQTCYAAGVGEGTIDFDADTTLVGSCYGRTIDAARLEAQSGTVFTPGALSVGGGVRFDNLWAGEDLTVGSNTLVSGSVTSATGDVVLQSGAKVLGSVTAGTSVTLGTGASVSGTRCPATSGDPGCPTNAPPELALPVLRCGLTDTTCWTARFPTLQTKTPAEMTAWLTDNQASLQGAFLINDTSGTIDFLSGGSLTGNLVIITRGKVRLGGDLLTADSLTAPSACTSSGATTCQVAIYAGSTSDTAIDVIGPSFRPSTQTISVLLHSAGTIRLASSARSVDVRGSLVAANLDFESAGASLWHSADLAKAPVDLVDWNASTTARYGVVNRGWRETTPVAPS